MSRLLWLLALLYALPLAAQAPLRVATYNVGLGRDGPGLLLKDIQKQTPDILAIADIIAQISPDILLLTGFDTDYQNLAVTEFNALAGLHYPVVFAPLGNAGLDSGLDLNGNGRLRDWNDAWGFGRFDGNEGMVLLSRYPIISAREFSMLLWKAFGPPPLGTDGRPYFAYWDRLRLASHSLWDLEISLPQGPLHILAAHPTPPVFDGGEDANGLRNAAEIGFLVRYLSGEPFRDDSGQIAPLPDSPVLVLADLNADPVKGESRKPALLALLTHPRLQSMPHLPTANWASTGPVQVDYVLPDKALTVLDSGVFGDNDPALINAAATRHRLIWADIELLP